MEEVKDYIETGILELYVLGLLTAPEQQEVEAMAAKHPEIRAEISTIERAMEQYAFEHAIIPSDSINDHILEKIDGPKTQPAKVIPLDIAERYSSKVRTLSYALVACIALLILSNVALFSAHSKLNLAHNQIASLTADKEKFATTVSFIQEKNADLQKIAGMSDDKDWKIVKLAGTKMDPTAQMIVYWHTSGKHVMVNNSKMSLPVNDKEHQYQLWALVNGKPVDLGVFDVEPDSNHILLNMKEISGAQTFAVTLEKRGGSVNPTMDQMIAAGNVAI